jgi:SulP family sulfate permease
MPNHHYPDDISFSSLRKDLQISTWETLRCDVLSALTVALMTLPQAMAYAVLAGLPLSCGLFASIYASIAASSFGSSRHLIMGPSNAIAILVQAGTAEVLFAYYRDLSGPERDMAATHILTQVVLLTGLLQILAAGCKLGRLTQFVSHSVVVGYIAGTAIAVIINQLFPFLGVPRMPGVHSLYERAAYLLGHVHQIHLPTILIGLSSLFLLIILRRINKRIPAGVISMVCAGIFVYFFDLSSYSVGYWEVDPYSDESVHTVALVGDAGNISDLMPKVSWPYFNTAIMDEILPVAFALALLSIMETTTVAKSIAANSGQRLSVNQEIFSVGVGNFVSAFIGAMPISGSPSRSMMNYNSGARTRFAAIFTGFFVLFFLYSLGFLVSMIPLAALSALLLFSAASIVNVKQLLICLKATSSDAFVLGITILSCIFFNLNTAFYIGVIISIILYLKKAAVPQLVEYDVGEAGELKNVVDFSSVHEHKQIRVIKVEGELFFGAADIFQTTLQSIAEDDTSTKVIILQLKNARDIDATACLALQQLYDYLKSSNRHLIACGITSPIWEVLCDSGIIDKVGRENLFIFDDRHPQHYMQKALQRAKELIEASLVKSQESLIRSNEPLIIQ